MGNSQSQGQGQVTNTSSTRRTSGSIRRRSSRTTTSRLGGSGSPSLGPRVPAPSPSSSDRRPSVSSSGEPRRTSSLRGYRQDRADRDRVDRGDRQVGHGPSGLGNGRYTHMRGQSESPSPYGSSFTREREDIFNANDNDKETKENREKEKDDKRRVHPSLQTKKKSLELPDLALTEVVTTNAPPPLPIAPIPLSSSPVSSSPPSSSSDPPPNSSPSKTPPAPLVLRSSIPFPPNLALPPLSPPLISPPLSSPRADRVNPQAREGERTYVVKISWRGGGDEVFLTRAGDGDWGIRRRMERDEDEDEDAKQRDGTGGKAKGAHSIIIALPRGTHHLRFIVDGETRVADDLPTAVADNGSLANYVGVGLSVPEVSKGEEGEGEVVVEGEEEEDPFWSEEEDSSPQDPSNQQPTRPRTRKTQVRYKPRWTTEIPLELLEAAEEEENYLVYQNNIQAQATTHRGYRVEGFVPLPNIPPAPRLPRYLDKLILNVQMAQVGVSGSPGGQGSPGGIVPGGGGAGVGPGRLLGERTVRERERERDRDRDRDRERDRDRDRGDRDRDRDRESRSPSAYYREGGRRRDSYHQYDPKPNSPNPNSITDGIPSIPDDTSVLPVPSHVVLHHLCTSAMRNGVLGVGETTRYRKKVGWAIFIVL
ncbi:hypothetical protein F5880DRAFT_309039 [Lentinula raphanica]|nr:hypothetical protein F5880DRAFT_309039 [Lentinula raphanica]